jgi:hypothetical protein
MAAAPLAALPTQSAIQSKPCTPACRTALSPRLATVLRCRDCSEHGAGPSPLLLATVASRAARRALLQSPGAYGDAAGAAAAAAAADPWGTAGGYYDPYGPGYIPGFINIDISQQYGRHVDVGPVAVDLTNDYAGFAISNAVGVGVARSGEGFDVQLGNGNIMDLSVTKSAGFGLWLLNGLVNINIGPDGRWNVVTNAATTAAAVTAASTAAAADVTVQGIQDAASRAATAASLSPGGAAASASSGGSSAPGALQQAAAAAGSGGPSSGGGGGGSGSGSAAAGASSAARKPCDGGTVVKVEGNRYTCKYKLGAAGSAAGSSSA